MKHIFHLEDLMVMYHVYNLNTLEKLIQCITCIIKQHGMKNYLWVNSVTDIHGIYPRKELAIMT